MPAMQHSVEQDDAGTRLDVWLARELRLTRGYVRRLLSHGAVRVNGTAAVKGTLLRPGDRIEVEPFRHPEQGPLPDPDVELRILHEAAGLIAVDKPAGRATQPLDFDETGSVLQGLLAIRPQVAGVGEGGLMSGVVHRLDRDTSGVLLFASDDAAWREARDAFEARSVDKRYRARVHGRFEGERELQLRLDHRGARMRVVETGGRLAHTIVRALEPGDDASLVEARPVTGVMHQLRATLAELGHPVVGDALYGSPLAQPRYWLHASSIRLELAAGAFEAESEPPPELRPST